MQRIEWDPEFNNDVDFVDDEHHAIVDHLNQLLTDVEEHATREVQLGHLGKLMTLTKEHFAHEEKVMRKSQFAEFVSHHHDHRKFLAKLRRVCRSVESGHHELSSRELYSLGEWLGRHILGADKRYGDLCREHKKV